VSDLDYRFKRPVRLVREAGLIGILDHLHGRID